MDDNTMVLITPLGARVVDLVSAAESRGETLSWEDADVIAREQLSLPPRLDAPADPDRPHFTVVTYPVHVVMAWEPRRQRWMQRGVPTRHRPEADGMLARLQELRRNEDARDAVEVPRG